MASDEKCPKCGGTHTANDDRNASCWLAIDIWPFVRDLQRRAEIGARAVELLSKECGDGGEVYYSDAPVFLDSAQEVLDDARAAGMVP